VHDDDKSQQGSPGDVYCAAASVDAGGNRRRQRLIKARHADDRRNPCVAQRPDMRGMRDDPAMKDYFAWAKKWYPDGNPEDGIVSYGYQTAQALEYVLRQCGDELTRENVMRVATHLDHVAFPMLLKGITATTSPTDYFPIKQFQMLRFDGKEWVAFGPIRGPE
jgi:hypothetical protein